MDRVLLGIQYILIAKTVILSTYAVAGRVPGTEHKAVSRKDIVPFLMEFTFGCQQRGKGDRQEIYGRW